MPKWKGSLLIAVAAALCVAQTATEFEAPAVNKIADKLHCTCGCKLTMACQMPPWPCPVCKMNKQRMVLMLAQGKSEQQILDTFVAENGPDILVKPPGIMGAAGPYIALVLGLALVAWVIARFMRKRPVAAVAGGPAAGLSPEDDNALLERYHDQIEKEIDKLD